MLYYRNILPKISTWLGSDNILVLHGSRQVGKTNILKLLQNQLEKENKPSFYIDLEDEDNLDQLNIGVEGLLKNIQTKSGLRFDITKLDQKIYVFIDEIQYLEKPSKLLKLVADHHKYIQLIVSGSSSFAIKSKFSDSLAGRTIEFEIFNLSFEEFLRFKNITLNLPEVRNSIPHLKQTVELYKEYMFFGGYPKVVLEPNIERKKILLDQIKKTYVQKDIRDLAQIRDIKKFNNLLQVLSYQTDGLLNIAQVCDICSLNRETVEKYIFLLENTYILKLLTPFSQNKQVEISKAPKVFFYDTGLSQILNYRQLNTNLVGNIFENSVFVELIKKHGTEDLFFWRTKTGTEVDFILNNNYQNQLLFPLEVKYSFRKKSHLGTFSFLQKYGLENYRIIGLEGVPTENMIYPWEI